MRDSLFSPGGGIRILFRKEQVYDEYHNQNSRKDRAYDDHGRAAYMYLVVQFTDQEAIGQKA